MIQPNIKRFQKSITEELSITKNRVRDLIGPAHWGEEGRYKEAILRKIIRQFLPVNLKVGTGFILKNEDHVHGELGETSKQLDLIIYDDTIPVIFKEGEFVILTEQAVRGVVEVKTKITNYSNNHKNALNNIVTDLDKLRIFKSFQPDNGNKKFVGIFSYDYDQNYLNKSVDEALSETNGLVNHISLGPSYFIRYWENTERLMPPVDHNGRCYLRYELTNLSFSYFISNLLHITANKDPVDRYWYSFPIQGTKEIHREEQIIELDD